MVLIKIVFIKAQKFKHMDIYLDMLVPTKQAKVILAPFIH